MNEVTKIPFTSHMNLSQRPLVCKKSGREKNETLGEQQHAILTHTFFLLLPIGTSENSTNFFPLKSVVAERRGRGITTSFQEHKQTMNTP